MKKTEKEIGGRGGGRERERERERFMQLKILFSTSFNSKERLKKCVTCPSYEPQSTWVWKDEPDISQEPHNPANKP
jgi:hypothetical protein